MTSSAVPHTTGSLVATCWRASETCAVGCGPTCAISRCRLLFDVSGTADPLDALAWVYLARGRYRAHATARRRCAGSQIVVAERFPHAAFASMPAPMDGPRLQHASGSGLIRQLAKREAHYYDLIGP